MANANIVILLGNLTRDPELSYTPNQTAVIKFGIAVNRKWKDSGGSKREEVCFIECTAFGIMGENINKYLSKGDPVFLRGRLRFEQWDSQDGRKCSKHTVVIEDCQFLGKAEQRESESEPASSKARQNSNDDIPF